MKATAGKTIDAEKIRQAAANGLALRLIARCYGLEVEEVREITQQTPPSVSREA